MRSDRTAGTWPCIPAVGVCQPLSSQLSCSLCCHMGMGPTTSTVFSQEETKVWVFMTLPDFQTFFTFLNTLLCTQPTPPLASPLVHSAVWKPTASCRNLHPASSSSLPKAMQVKARARVGTVASAPIGISASRKGGPDAKAADLVAGVEEMYGWEQKGYTFFVALGSFL